MDRDDPAYAGQRDYGPLLLRLYDPDRGRARLADRVATPRPTRCSTGSARGSAQTTSTSGRAPGYFLDHSGLPDGSPITILDPNTNVLDHVSKRLRRFDVTAVEADVLKPLPVARDRSTRPRSTS